MICCMQQVARCFNRAYGLQLSTRGEMECAYQGERLTPSLCGRMVGIVPAAAIRVTTVPVCISREAKCLW